MVQPPRTVLPNPWALGVCGSRSPYHVLCSVESSLTYCFHPHLEHSLFCYCSPPALGATSSREPSLSSIWEHRAESELQSDSAWLGRTWRPLQASRVARTVLRQAGIA